MKQEVIKGKMPDQMPAKLALISLILEIVDNKNKTKAVMSYFLLQKAKIVKV